MKKIFIFVAPLLLIPSFVKAQTCTQTFTPANIGTNGANVNTAVAGGSASTVLCFSSGSYANIIISGANPSGKVTLTPSGGASVNMGLFTVISSSNILITGFSGSSSSGGISLQGNNQNITFSHNAMTTNGVEIRDDTIANANLVMDSNTYIGFAGACETCRIHIFNNACPQSGITISNSIMSGGADDGIQWGGCGVNILNNEFSNLTGNAFGIHQDAMQGVGDTNSVIRGNYAHGVANCWQMTDGTSNATIEDNVCIADGSDGHSGQICSQTLLFNHNTIVSPYGINIGNDSGGKSSSNITLTNNIFNGQFSVNNGQPITGTFTQNYNLCYTGGCAGSNSLSGTPTYVGGVTPTIYAGFALTSTSLGHNAGNDGKDMGTLPVPVAPPRSLTAAVQ
jgi:hypothetical protein